MTVIDKQFKGFRGTKRMVDCLILADAVPDPLPIDGTNIEGMTADEVFAPGSILYVVGTGTNNAVYLANESGEFVLQS